MSDCIEWTGATTGNGYGQKRSKGKRVKVHRLVWAEANGPIPQGLKVLHTCDNPPCYNLEHLYLGTHAKNMQDMADRGRTANGRKTHCKQGHEFSIENTGTNGKRRWCKTCVRDRKRVARCSSV